MTIIKLHHRHPRSPINCTSVPLLALPLDELPIRDESETAVVLLLANPAPAQVQQLHTCTAASALTKLERYFIKNGWMPKEA